MKKTTIFLTMLMATCFSFAQMSDKFVKAMETLVPAVDTTHSMGGLTELANSFERIANAETNQWLPFYYAALCNVSAGTMIGSGGKLIQSVMDDCGGVNIKFPPSDSKSDKVKNPLFKPEQFRQLKMMICIFPIEKS